MKKKNIVTPVLSFGYTVFYTFGLLVNRAYAQRQNAATGTVGGDNLNLPIPLPQPDGSPSDLAVWLPQVLNLAIGLAALVCVAVLIGSGYMYITAAGDETKVEKATKSLTYAIIGLIICFISVILVQFVLRNVLGAGTN